MSKVVHWFRQDLRLTDNPALFEAIKIGKVLPIYILDEENAGDYKMGEASKIWLHYSLLSLNKSIDGKLLLLKGNPQQLISQIVSEFKINNVFWNRCYQPWHTKLDKKIKNILEKKDVNVNIHNGSLLWEPWQNLKDNGDPYKIFTPYYKKAYKTQNPRYPIAKPETINFALVDATYHKIDYLNLLPSKNWFNTLIGYWDISEEGAMNLLYNFLENGVKNYKEGRNFPAKNNNSRLSPYLHFGQISPNQVWHEARFYDLDANIENFCLELGWREFSFNLLYYFPHLPKKNLQPKFDTFPWNNKHGHLEAWKKGQTGYPIVDAGMRELWQTGFMHNRIRMVVGSFLVKNLLIHWHEGERWFWNCLVDADLASNSASWQWVAGCGADAAPYFRIFNPITQGERFDIDGKYTKKYVPELAKLPNKYLFKPWEAPEKVLKTAGVDLGKTYPMPIVDIKQSRELALSAYLSIK